MATVALVGKGERFDVMASLLESAGARVVLWQPDAKGRKRGKLPAGFKRGKLEDLADIPLIFLALPMHRVRETSRELGGVVTGRHIVVHTTRNLEPATLKTVSQILKEETPTHRFGFLTGPMRAEDVLHDKPSAGVCATEFAEVYGMVEDCLVSEKFRVYRGDALHGAEVAAAYARIIAMACGIAAELELGTSIQATLFTRGLAEVSRYVVYQGGYERTAFGLAAAGNLYADTQLPGSMAFRIGRQFVQAGGIDGDAIRAEFGVDGDNLINLLNSLALAARAAELGAHILEVGEEMVAGKLTPARAVDRLMALPAYQE